MSNHKEEDLHELNYVGSNELVYTNEKNNQIHAGGFSVNSILMKAGVSPIMTIHNPAMVGGGTKVSDLFNHLVVPNWALSYNNRLGGGKYRDRDLDSDSDSDSDSDNDVVKDDLHDQLLSLVNEHNKLLETRRKHTKKKRVHKINKATRRHSSST